MIDFEDLLNALGAISEIAPKDARVYVDAAKIIVKTAEGVEHVLRPEDIKQINISAETGMSAGLAAWFESKRVKRQ